MSAFELGTAYLQEPLARRARPVLGRLVDAVGHTAHLAVLHGREVLHVVEDLAPGGPPLVTDGVCHRGRAGDTVRVATAVRDDDRSLGSSRSLDMRPGVPEVIDQRATCPYGEVAQGQAFRRAVLLGRGAGRTTRTGHGA